ncbi:MAG: hypothetical protein J7M38_08875 [Armatimonadetes bacterium]|nr:hypothetical protein [Armatimonadota bacterium]
MQELVTVEQADALIRILAWGGPMAGVVIGTIWGGMRRRLLTGAARGFAVGLLGPIVWLMWLLYCWMVRYNPATGEAGLQSVATMALNALIFLTAGIVLGGLYSRIVFAERPEEISDSTANSAQDTDQAQTAGAGSGTRAEEVKGETTDG